MKKRIIFIKILISGILFLTAMLIYTISDSSGHDPSYNLQNGYYIDIVNQKDKILIYWDKELEEKSDGIEDAGEKIIEGNITQYSYTNDIILVKKGQYYCIDKKTKKVIHKNRNLKKMKDYLETIYGISKIELQEL